MKRVAVITTTVLLMAMQAPPASVPAAPVAPTTQPLQLDEALLAPKPSSGEGANASDTPRDFDAAAFRDAVRRSNAAMGDKDWAGAESALQEALALKPDSKEAAYNLGLAQYMQGKFKDAAKRFEESAAGASSIKDARASADLAARSMYNQGRARYGELLDMLEKAPPVGPDAGAQQPLLPPGQLKKAIKLAQNSLTHFKDAAIANPGDQDSAANAETSLQLLKQLRKLQQRQLQQQKSQKQDQQKQQEQDQKQKQDQQQSQQQTQEPNQSQDSEQNEQQNSQQQQQQQDQSSNPNQNDSSKDQPSAQQDQKKSEDKQPSQQNPKQDQQPDQKPDPKKDPQKQPTKDPKKDETAPQSNDSKPEDSSTQGDQKQEPAEAQPADGKPGDQKAPSLQQAKADKLLQLVRDKEKARNAERQATKGQNRPTPVDRDW